MLGSLPVCHFEVAGLLLKCERDAVQLTSPKAVKPVYQSHLCKPRFISFLKPFTLRYKCMFYYIFV